TAVDIHILQGEREMAQDNKTLGRFQLSGIAPAPRGIPQIEVTFDIDANGIVNVSAKDLGTGQEQKITITASTNLSDEDIDKAVKEAEQFAEEDKKKKEAIEIRNQADTLVYQSEKALEELKDKVTEEDTAKVKSACEKVKTALAGTDTDAIKSATEELQKEFYEISAKLYAQANPEGQPGADATNEANGDVVDDE
ncbi:MAG: Hsp70 family protein, partial [Clostridia bacterium]|nr:Hsp70 family protein [Clostridia bacterium]